MTGQPELRLLDGFEFRRDGEVVSITPGAQRVLALLALHPSRPVLRTYVAGSLWPDKTDARAAGNLRSALWRLPDAGDPVVATARTLQLGPAVICDVDAMERKARRLLDRSVECDDEELCIDLLDVDLLPTWSDDWVVLERERIRQLRVHALDALTQRLTEARRYGDAIEVGLVAIADEPLRESAHRAVIAAHLAEGNRSEALRQFQRYRSSIRRELGLEPSEQLRSLVEEATSR